MPQNLDDMPIEIRDLIYKARDYDDSYNAAKIILKCLDYTSLNENDSTETIKKLCEDAVTEFGKVAAVCVLPEHVKTAAISIASDIKVATVISFPDGIDSPDKIAIDTMNAINNGADEIDIVFNWNSFIHEGEEGKEISREALLACKDSCGYDSRMKVILETGKFNNYESLHEAAIMSLGCGADFLKTSTGKAENTAGASMEAAAVLLKVLNETESSAGIKISGGVKDVESALIYMQLAKNIMGPSWVNKDRFRIGSSSLLENILDYIEK